jgi:hypothetical protein
VDFLDDPEEMTPERREAYAEVFREGSRSRHKDYLRKRITRRLQANEEDGASVRDEGDAVGRVPVGEDSEDPESIIRPPPKDATPRTEPGLRPPEAVEPCITENAGLLEWTAVLS